MTAPVLLDQLRKNPFVLAPMAGITDCAFRSFMKEYGASIVISELVSCHGIEYSSQKTLDLMRFSPDQQPVGIQLFGESPESLAKAAQVVERSGAAFVDLNFGCPVPKVVKKGAGSAILRDVVAVRDVFRAVKAAISIPLTVKIRTGWDQPTRNAVEVAQIAYDEGLTWVAIHGRTRAQGYSGLADWDYIGEVKAKSRLPILGNGDLVTASQAVGRLSEFGLDGVMIGRGCLKNPWIFVESLALWQSQMALRSALGASAVTGAAAAAGKASAAAAAAMAPTASSKDFSLLFLKLYQAFSASVPERALLLQLKKFASWYSTGYPGAAQFRKTVFGLESPEHVLKGVQDFFANVPSELIEHSLNNEGFLMGGHG